MKKIEAFIRHDRFEGIRAELYAIGLPSLSVVEALGSGRQGGIVEHYRGATETLFLRPKLKLEMVVADEDVDGRGRGHPEPRPHRGDGRREDLRPARGARHPHPYRGGRSGRRLGPSREPSRRGRSVMRRGGSRSPAPPAHRFIRSPTGHPGFEEHHAEAGA